MIGFEVRVNEEEPLVGGIEGYGALSCVVTRKATDDVVTTRLGMVGREGSAIHDFGERALALGDVVRVRIVELDRPPVPVSTRPFPPQPIRPGPPLQRPARGEPAMDVPAHDLDVPVLGFEVRVRERIVRASLPGRGSISVGVHGLRRRAGTALFADQVEEEDVFAIEVYAVDEGGRFLRWLSERLSSGDEVVIRVAELTNVDATFR